LDNLNNWRARLADGITAAFFNVNSGKIYARKLPASALINLFCGAAQEISTVKNY